MRPDSTFYYLGYRLDCEPTWRMATGYQAQVAIYGPDGALVIPAEPPGILNPASKDRRPAIEQGFRVGKKLVNHLLFTSEERGPA